jgi:tetrahydromethanopterin S-methyltransferase subunit H
MIAIGGEIKVASARAVSNRRAACDAICAHSSLNNRVSMSSTRSSALSAAWSLTDVSARNAAIKAAWQAFAKSGKAAREAWKTAQKTARKTFRDGAKACGISASDASLSETENDVNVGE